MNRSDCPDPAQLLELLGRKSDSESAQRLEAHLLECETCALSAETLFPENEVTAFRESTPIRFEDSRDERIVEALIHRGKALRTDFATVTPEQTQIGMSMDDDDVPADSKPSRSESDSTDDLSFLAPPQQSDEIGRLGDYRILQVLGRGGMGVVFRAEDPRLKRQVALKVMKPSIAASRSAKDRFLREAQFTAAIEHDHIVHIYQVGEDRGVPFIAMPFLKGESLKTKLEREGRLRQSEVVRIGKEVAAGLAAAHDRGLIHRDIKPDNIWIEEKTGRAKILDFGLVRSVSDDTELTQSGMVLGTPKYMAPEQAQGQNVDHRCDLFSLGSVLYHLATGKPAFEGNNLTATLMAVVHQEPQPIEAVSPDIHPQLATLIAELVKKDRDQRPQSANIVSQRLADIEQALKNPSAGVATAAADTLPHGIVTGAVPIASANIAEVSIVTQPVIRRVPPQPPQGRKLAMAAGAGGLLLVLGILIITIRNKHGKETTIRVPDGVVADIDVQPGSKVSIREEASGAGEAVDPAGMKSAIDMKGAAGIADRALRFSDKGQYADIPAFTQWGDTPLTVEAVVRFNTDGPGQFFVLDGWIVLANDPREEIGILSQLVLNEDDHILHAHPAATEIGATCHIAIVRTATTFDLYVNGVRAADAPGQVTWSTAEFKSLEQGKLPELKLQPVVAGTLIGNFKDWTTRCDVTFSELRISNTARYQADFKPQYRYEPDEHTLALYHFDEGEGTILQDASPNQRHGIIYGGTWLNDGITTNMELQTRSRINVQKEASFLATEERALWPVGPLPAWASEEPRWSIMKESFTIPGAVERPTEFQGIGRWNVDTIQSRGLIHVARYSPDGKWLATGSGDGHVRVYEAATMKLHQLLPGVGGGSGAGDLSWHPDSRRIAVAADNSTALRIWTIEGRLLHEEIMHDQSLDAVAWTFDGSRLICGGANRLDVRDADGLLLKSLTEGQPVLYCSLGNIATSPNSQRFVIWHQNQARIWNAETLELEHTIDIPFSNSSGGHRIRWSSNDQISLSLNDRLVICSADGNVVKEFPSEPLCATAWRPDGVNLTIWRLECYNLNTDSGESTPATERMFVSPASGPVPTAIDWSPDGKRLVVACGGLAVCNESLNKIDFDTSATLMSVSSISLNPDGSQISSVSMVSDDSVRIWTSDGTARQALPLDERVSYRSRVAWSPDGQHIAVVSPVSNRLRIGNLEGSFEEVAGQFISIAWNPDGTQLAAGHTNGHILITDHKGQTLHDVDTGESSPVVVGWSKQGMLVAYVGKKILRINPDSAESKVALLTEVPVAQSDNIAVWRPDGAEVFFSPFHVNVADGVTDRVREAAAVAAWAPDGMRYLLGNASTAGLFLPDDTLSLYRRASATISAPGAWSPSGETVYVGCDQSLLMARNAEDLHVKWSAVILPNQKSITFDVGGSVSDGDRDTLDSHFMYYTADEKGNVSLLSPAEFELRVGKELLPEPGRYFDAEYGFSFTAGDAWKSTPLESVAVPGVARAAFTKTGGVSLNVFVQETGDLVDASWLLSENVKAQEEKVSATVLEKEVRKIAGRDAAWMIVEGQGTGSDIDGKGSVKTTQHWVAIPRENDVIVALLSSPSGTFASNQTLFLQAIETLKLRGVTTAP